MNVFKKIMSTVVATTTLLTGMTFPVSATTYDNCDANRDGVVNVRDAAAIASYRSSNVYVPNYNQLDADKNLVINSMDEQRVMAKIMGYSYSSSYYSKKNKTTSNASAVSEFVSSVDDASTSAREYKRYDYEHNKQLSNYTLYPSTKSLASSVQSRIVIGADERYISSGSENTGIVHIYNGLGKYATGFIVDDHHIATAAHCVYDGDWLPILGIYGYKYNGEISDTEFNPVEAHIPNEYNPNETDGYKKYKYDYALITVEEDLSGYVHFDLGTSYSVNTTNFKNIPIYVTGCPKETNTGASNSIYRLFTGEGNVIDKYVNTSTSVKNTEILNYDTDMQQGCSGGPAYTVTKNIVNGQASYTYTAVAINSFEVPPDEGNVQGMGNGGALITKYLLQFYKNNPNVSY